MERVIVPLQRTLQTANAKIKEILHLAAQQQLGPVQVTADHLSDLLSELSQASTGFHTHAGKQTVELDREIAEYRHNLEKLRAILPDLQARLLAERACLERERNHLKAATRWAQTSHNTL